MKRLSLAIVTLFACAGAQAASEEVEMNLVTSGGIGQSIGTVKISETDKGLEFAPTSKPCRLASMAFTFTQKVPANPR